MPAHSRPYHHRRRSKLPRLAIHAAIWALTATLASPLAHADTPPPPALTDSQIAAVDAARSAEHPPEDDADAALAQAKATGQNVPIASLTTAFSETAATPAGHLLQTSHVDQQRAKKNGAWAPLDATLTANPDGSYSPTTSASGVTLSKGGGNQLATLTSSDGTQLSLNSPFTLPTPAVSGDSLLYQVATDTTLKVTATKYGGLSTVLILNTPAAAANPALKTLHFDTLTKGVTVSSDTANNLTAKATDGTVRWSAPAPKMWDSSTTSSTSTPAASRAQALSTPTPTPTATNTSAGTAPAASTADGPGAGAKVADMPVTTTTSGIDLTPDQSILTTGTGPWYIDPSWYPAPATANAWTWVQSAYPTLTSNYGRTGTNDSDYPGIGTCGTYPNGGSCSPPPPTAPSTSSTPATSTAPSSAPPR